MNPLKKYQLEHGLSGIKLARKLGFPQEAVYKWLNNERMPQAANLIVIWKKLAIKDSKTGAIKEVEAQNYYYFCRDWTAAFKKAQERRKNAEKI